MRGVLQFSKRGGLEFPPQFSREEILFFPISVSAEVGDEWEFEISHKKPVGNDRHGTPMFVCSIVLVRRIETITVLNFQTLIVHCGNNSKEVPANGVRYRVSQDDVSEEVILQGTNDSSCHWKTLNKWDIKELENSPIYEEFSRKKEVFLELKKLNPDKVVEIFESGFEFFCEGEKIQKTHSSSSGFWSGETPNLEIIERKAIEKDGISITQRTRKEFGIVRFGDEKDRWNGGEFTEGGRKVEKRKVEIDEKKILTERLDRLVEKFIFTRDNVDLEELMQLAGVLVIDGKSLIAKKLESEE